MSIRVRWPVTVAALVTTLAAEEMAFAAPDDRELCASSAEQGQQLRDEGKYRHAREQMLVCARDICPGPIKSDCGKWLMELDRDAPTVVFGARDTKGADILDVKVSMDDVAIQDKLDGKPVLVDSGEHRFKFELKDGTVKEERVLLRAAEKARPIIVTFNRGGTAPDSGAGAGSADSGSTPSRSVAPALIVGGIGVAALGSFALFGLGGKNDVDELQKCKPNCADKDIDKARMKLLIADISLGVGVVALGVATYMLITRPKVDAKMQTGTSLRFDVGPVAGGGIAGVGGNF